MTPARLVACHFGGDSRVAAQWARLARVLAWSAGRQCPGWELRITMLPPAPGRERNASYEANAMKLSHWTDAVAAARDGDRLLLADADLVVLRPLDDVWALPFDVALTTKASRFPLNAGVVFLRVSQRTRDFMAEWRDENARMLRDPRRHDPWRQLYGGLNQAAMGAILARTSVPEQPVTPGLRFARLPCAEWNCEDSSWPQFGPATRIVHVKSALRRAVFSQGPTTLGLRPLAKLWRALEREALAAEGPQP